MWPKTVKVIEMVGGRFGDVFDVRLEWKSESGMTLGFHTSGDAEMEQLSTSRRTSPTFFISNAGATTSSVLLVLSLMKLAVVQIFVSRRQLTSGKGGSWVEGWLLMYSWVSSA